MLQLKSSTGYDEALAFLLGRIDYERMLAIPDPNRAFRLERMRTLLGRLGDPHLALKIIHLAGTKGKGSTSAMLASILSAAGYRPGLYTSPHLDRLEERIMIDGRPCEPAILAALVDRLRPVVDQLDAEGQRSDPPDSGPTYFEIATAMAFLHFAEAKTDAAVVEVGLGGRLDGTNVCQPLVTAITSISFDHTKQLGTTLGAIAREKAGIIKPGVPLVSGVREAEPRQVIAEIAAEQRSTLRQAGVDFDYDYQPPRNLETSEELSAPARLDFDYRVPGREHRLDAVELGLIGRHQAANAAVALAATAELQAQSWQIPEQAIRSGLASLQWPARIEIVSRRPVVVVDAAHNTASIECLLQTLDESFACPRRLLIFATTQDKDVRGMLRLLLPRFDEVILTRYVENSRAVSIAELEALAAELSPIPRWTAPDPAAAWSLAQQKATPDHLICITGSFFLAAGMRREIARSPLAGGHPS